jgi:rhodanese-related sulfurtransferase
MSIIKDILGGLIIVVVAGVVAVAQNAIRKDGIPLVPSFRASEVGKQEDPASSPSDNASTGPEVVENVPVGTATAAALTEEELAAGRVSRDRLKALMDAGAVVLIDARTTGEYEAGHIAGAINVPYERFVDYYNTLDETVPLDSVIVCYCQSETCDDSENLARELKFMGYRKVVLYKGGWDEWSLAGYPVFPTPEQE